MSDIASVIAHLLQQRSAIDNALEALRGIGEGTPAKKRGRPKGTKATKKGAMSAEGRQRQSEAPVLGGEESRGEEGSQEEESLASAWRSRRAKLAQKLGYRDDGHAVVLPELQQVLIAGHDVIGMGGLGAFEDCVVVWVVLHHVEDHLGGYVLRNAQEHIARLLNVAVRPIELHAQDSGGFNWPDSDI